MAENTIKAVVDETIKTAFGRSTLNRLIRDEIGALTVALVNKHVEAGRFMSGEYANKGYSEATLPAFFLGDIQKAGDDWQIRSKQFNVTVDPKDKFIWRWNDAKDQPTAYLVGGYKEFRRLAGRDNSIVNLTFTGRMMNSVDFRPVISRNTFRVEVGAFGGNQDKAYYTDKQREWLVLFGDEQEKIKREAEKFITKRLNRLGDETIRIS